jgi:hypothetical protein
MLSPALRSDVGTLRVLAIGAGLCWSLVFVGIALCSELQLYADGAIFSYAVAVQDVWAFHWHNISPRVSVFFLTLWPGEVYVGLTGDPRGGITVYGFLFNIAPLLGLIGTYAADHSRGRIIFSFACGSTALLCPLVFGFPTEMWLAHAMFWPTLAISQYAHRSAGGTALVSVMMIALVLSHEGAVVLALGIVSILALRGRRDATFLRASGALIAALATWGAVKMLFPPGEYFADVLTRAALHFFDLNVLEANLVLLLAAALASYALIHIALSQFVRGNAHLLAAAATVVALAVYWLWFDHSLHASNRYYLRTALVLVTPLLGALAGLFAMRADGSILPAPGLGRLLTTLSSSTVVPALLGAFMLMTLIYAVETAKFVAFWERYKSAVAALATGLASDPSLGDPRFVSSERIGSDLNRLSWNSTTPYLSVIAANFTPNRLVVDPTANYFWLSCKTATKNDEAVRSVPETGRRLVKIYACLHRQ